ncbi:uncharacterized protein NFIA_005160 [Aspergillus fischeri NRRL 181]|uniref:Uncharacterized protein n=1 Tax=Neosartorya fischeri (strain ATCC 1020 / DSM 3700 / CBS 544.65 / FGSC A1164 / JCM 1740 / NRRL 181 / WB 181) TaxID=331117 RepID=A1DKB5_NEOFI|nr:uncharacterized protein NFIA_005160 [Aspergillus fischeri NRRL 181]EAW17154.1 hypothetical protein NFIA_005160 [Aspergillus fischeri NRRL 181]
MPGAEVLVGARLAALSTQTPADDHNNNDDSYDEDGAQQEVMKAQKLITKYYDDLQEPVKREEQFDIILSLLVHAGKMRNKLPKNADGRQRQSYEAMALILEKTAAHFDWPKDWRFAKRSV